MPAGRKGFRSRQRTSTYSTPRLRSADCSLVETGYVCATPGQACVLSCGDGSLDSGEACDLGTALNDGSYGGCRSNCRLAPYCGDGILTLTLNRPDLRNAITSPDMIDEVEAGEFLRRGPFLGSR